MKILYPTNRPDIGPLMIMQADNGMSYHFFFVSMLTNSILLESRTTSEEKLIEYYSLMYGDEWRVEDYPNPVDALLDMGHWFHKRNIYTYHHEVEQILNSFDIPSLNDSDRELIEYDAQHDEYMVRVYDQAVKDARASGYPLWISDAYYGIDLGMK